MPDDTTLDDFEREEAPIEFREYKNVRAEREARERMPGDGDE